VRVAVVLLEPGLVGMGVAVHDVTVAVLVLVLHVLVVVGGVGVLVDPVAVAVLVGVGAVVGMLVLGHVAPALLGGIVAVLPG
jgi:hypothetical protein